MNIVPETKMIKKEKFWLQLKNQRELQILILMGMAWLLIFNFLPILGVSMAFNTYKAGSGFKGFFTGTWVGLKYFIQFFKQIDAWQMIRNTIYLSVLKLVFGLPVPILFALMINELKNAFFKKFVQTVSYLPHFISWVVVGGLVIIFFSADGGMVNNVLMQLRLIAKPIPITYSPDYFWGLAVMTEIWKETGWWTIIYLAALTGINPELYEAASIDGASRLQKVRYISLPGIKGAMVVVFILSIGSLLSGGLSGSNFDQAYIMGNSFNSEHSQILQTYIMKMGLAQGQYSFATAIGILLSIVSLMLVLASNYIAKKISGESLF